MDTSKNFYVGIENSKVFRRNLLEASKNTVSILRFYHKIIDIRKQKQDKLNLLKSNLNEINNLMVHLDDAMPDMGIRAASKKLKPAAHKEHVLDKPPIEKQSPKVRSEIDELEDQLKEIDSRLNNI